MARLPLPSEVQQLIKLGGPVVWFIALKYVKLVINEARNDSGITYIERRAFRIWGFVFTDLYSGISCLVE